MTTISLSGVERRCRLWINGRNRIGANGNRLCEPGICLNRVAAELSAHHSQIGQWRRATAGGWLGSTAEVCSMHKLP
jgi:hypothetical protein